MLQWLLIAVFVCPAGSDMHSPYWRQKGRGLMTKGREMKAVSKEERGREVMWIDNWHIGSSRGCTELRM